MFNHYIVPQSAGSLSVAVLSLIMGALQLIFYLKKPNVKWFAWSVFISLSSLIYAVGIFLEYNTTGSLNRVAGLLEFTAVIFLVHCLYGFTFTHLEIDSKHYHTIAGIFHCIIILFLWLSGYIVSYEFVDRDFYLMSVPFAEPDLGPLGPLFELYIALSCLIAIIIWLKHKGPGIRNRKPFIIGMSVWIVLGIHDGLASISVPSLQYLMEYGFFGFSIVILWVVFESYIDISAVDKYRVITEHANEGILVIRDEKIIFANPACENLIGSPLINVSTEEFLNLILAEDRSKFRQYFDKIFTSDSPGLIVVRPVRDPGKNIIEAKGNPIDYMGHPAALFVFRNITERLEKERELKKSEEKILRLKKMESLGLLAGGVAHDLNNVISGIVTYPELILMEMPEDNALRKSIQVMHDAGQRAAAIVHDLLTIARGVAIPKETLNLNNIITKFFRTPEYDKLLEFHNGVELKSNLDSDLMNIKGSIAHIGKIIMNLLSNAFEAIEKSGAVLIETMNRYLDRPLKGYEDVNVGEYVVLAVSDTGPGISSDDIERIFEPFYTKKVMGRSGTGLGLTVVWNIVQDHNGYINIINEKIGTKFEIYLPITRDSIIDRDIMALADKIYGNGETILVIDDMKSQREMLCHILEVLKYNPKSAASGEEAVEYLKSHKVDLIVLDMIMDPGINGRVTYERIKEIHPDQKAIIVSGFAETEEVKMTLKLGAGRFLEKPLSLTEFGLAVKVELEK